MCYKSRNTSSEGKRLQMIFIWFFIWYGYISNAYARLMRVAVPHLVDSLQCLYMGNKTYVLHSFMFQENIIHCIVHDSVFESLCLLKYKHTILKFLCASISLTFKIVSSYFVNSHTFWGSFFVIKVSLHISGSVQAAVLHSQWLSLVLFWANIPALVQYLTNLSLFGYPCPSSERLEHANCQPRIPTNTFSAYQL